MLIHFYNSYLKKIIYLLFEEKKEKNIYPEHNSEKLFLIC